MPDMPTQAKVELVEATYLDREFAFALGSYIRLTRTSPLPALTHTCIKCPGWSAYSCDSTGRTTAWCVLAFLLLNAALTLAPLSHDSYLLNGECTFNCNGNGAAAKVVPAPAGFTYAPMPWIGYRIGSFGVCEGST